MVVDGAASSAVLVVVTFPKVNVGVAVGSTGAGLFVVVVALFVVLLLSSLPFLLLLTALDDVPNTNVAAGPGTVLVDDAFASLPTKLDDVPKKNPVVAGTGVGLANAGV